MSNAELIDLFTKDPTKATLEEIGGAGLVPNIGAPKLEKGKKIITRGGKQFITDEDAPEGFLPRIGAGIADIFLPGDQDKRGGFQNPFKDVSEETIGLKELRDSDYKYTPLQTRRIKKALETELKGPKTALEETQEYLNSYKQILGDDELRNLIKSRNREAAVENQLQYLATEPIRQAFLNRAAEQAAQRGLRVRGALEAMPSNVQNIMLSKQAQAATAASAEAELRKAAAIQQDAATRFAGLGMQRRFG